MQNIKNLLLSLLVLTLITGCNGGEKLRTQYLQKYSKETFETSGLAIVFFDVVEIFENTRGTTVGYKLKKFDSPNIYNIHATTSVNTVSDLLLFRSPTRT